MMSIDALMHSIVEAIGLDESEIKHRWDFLEFGEKDVDQLRGLHTQLKGARSQFIDAFYDHLLHFSQTRKLIATPELQARLRHKQSGYFEQLTAGKYDWDYVTDRLRVGLVHQRVGLDPQWYLGAYCKYLTELIPQAWVLAEDEQSAADSVRALLKIVFFDMGLALETYFQADRKSIIALKEYAENIVCSVPAGLLVLSADLNVLSANRFVDRLFAAGHEALVGHNLEELFHDKLLVRLATEVLETDKSVQHVGVVAFDQDAGERWFEVALSPFQLGAEVQQDPALAHLQQARLLLTLEDVTKQHQLRSASRRSEARIQSVLDNVVDGIITIDIKGVVESYNRAAEHIFGYTAAEVIGNNVNMLMPDEHRSRHDGYLKHFERSGEAGCLGLGFREVQGLRKDGGIFPMELSTSEMCLDDQQLFIGVVRDISMRKAAEAEREKLASALSQTADSVIITDASGVIEYINTAFEKTTGYSYDEVVGKTPSIVKSGKHSETFYKRLWQTIRDGNVFSGILVNRRRDGMLYYEEKTITPIKDALSGAITHYVSTGKDITERMQAQQRLDYLAHHDVLTDLPNRTLFQDRLQRAIGRVARNKRQIAVMFLDLDRFKQINDTLGHDAGDRLLRAVASRFSRCLRLGDTVARLGGDEFAILLEDLVHVDDVLPILEKLLDVMKDPFELDGQEFFISFSIGVSMYPGDGEDASMLLRNADTAMYRAKAEGCSSYRFYTSDMNARALERLGLESKLRRALERNEFILYYQPKFSLSTMQVIGVEALIRWNHPELGLVSPADFIPMLEETGMIVPVGRWVLHESCRQVQGWREDGLKGLSVAVNISAHQFRRDDVQKVIEEVLVVYNMPQDLLELEITESSIMHDVGRTTAAVQSLKECGVKVSIDDFGTGYSSLAYLKRFAIDSLKIDRTFVRDICEDQDDAAIVSAVVAMAKHLQLTVVAEGVETKEQLNFLREQGCDQVQGFLLGRPMPGSAFPGWLAGYQSLS